MALLPEANFDETEPEREGLLALRAERYARAVPQPGAIIGKAMTFRRCGSSYSVLLESLKEVRPLGEMCHLVGARAVVPGILHHRGELLSVHDLAAFVGEQDGTAPAWAVVLEHDDLRVALLADELLEVVTIEQSDVQDVPITLGEAAGGFASLYAGDILLLDVPALFDNPAFMDAY